MRYILVEYYYIFAPIIVSNYLIRKELDFNVIKCTEFLQNINLFLKYLMSEERTLKLISHIADTKWKKRLSWEKLIIIFLVEETI